MTSLLCWTGADQRGNSSIYLASDSRISTGANTWDAGRKLFASPNRTDILGYCGDAYALTTVLSQLTDAINQGVLFSPEDSLSCRKDRIIKQIQDSLSGYFASTDFDVIYGYRESSGMQCVFHVVRLSCRKSLLKDEVLSIPPKSDRIITVGSGAAVVDKYIYKWQESNSGDTSRMYFSAFCDAIKSGEDPRTFGPPQLVGLYREGSAKTFGVVYEGNRYMNGQKIAEEYDVQFVTWHNELFELCDGKSMSRKKDAQPQPRPANVKG